MKKDPLTRELEELHEKFKKLYNPRTAFGNIELIRLADSITQLQKLIDETKPCRDCEATGYTAHSCDCDHCTTQTIECEECQGTGRKQLSRKIKKGNHGNA